MLDNIIEEHRRASVQTLSGTVVVYLHDVLGRNLTFPRSARPPETAQEAGRKLPPAGRILPPAGRKLPPGLGYFGLLKIMESVVLEKIFFSSRLEITSSARLCAQNCIRVPPTHAPTK